MRNKEIAKNLKKSLMEDGPLADALYNFELKEHLPEYLESKREDGDKFLVVVAERLGNVAMLLIDEDDEIHVNGDAREMLRKLWKKNYKNNLKTLIPDMANEIAAGFSYFFGVKVIE